MLSHQLDQIPKIPGCRCNLSGRIDDNQTRILATIEGYKVTTVLGSMVVNSFFPAEPYPQVTPRFKHEYKFSRLKKLLLRF